MKDYRIGAYEKAFPEEISVAQMLSLARETGYDYFQMSIDRTDKRIARLDDRLFIEDLRKAMKESGIAVESICLSALSTYTAGHPDDQIRERSLDIFHKAVDFASELGMRNIQIPACDVGKFENYDEKTDQLFRESLRKMSCVAGERGIMLGMENMENGYADSVEKCLDLINDVNSPYLQLYPDAGNIYRADKISGHGYLEDLALAKGRMIAFHLKETRDGKYGGLFYGQGDVDFAGQCKLAYQLGVRRFVLEYWYTGNPQWKEDLKKAGQLCCKWIEE